MIESIMFILLFGLLANKLFSKLKLPGLLGMILVGILLGPHGMKLLDSSIMDNSSQIRSIALIIILLRAGLGLNKEMLKKVGKVSIKMSAIPCLCEGFLILFGAIKILHLPFAEAGMLAFIIAAVSPAVVVPAMIQLKEKKLGIKKGVPVLILAGSSIDDIFAITIFTIFLGMGTKKSVSTSITSQLVKIPVEILGGIILGALAAYVLVLIFKTLNNSSLEKLCIVLIAAFAVYTIGQSINVSGLLSVMTIGFILLEKIEKEAKELEKGLNKIWFFAQIFLFVLIGAEVNISVAFGAGLAGIAVIIIGLIGRTIGVMISLAGSHLNIKERFFCAIAYIPKATVQAAIGGIPLASGVVSGELILAIAVLAIIITAPLGAIGISTFAPRLLEDDSNGVEEVA
jgi:solute carrier family 9B (sodium/hydrogen exchanger), member 1/2